MVRVLALLAVALAWSAIAWAETPDFAGRYAGEDVKVELHAAGRPPDQGL